MIMQQLGKPSLSENSSRTRDDESLDQVQSNSGFHQKIEEIIMNNQQCDESNFVPTTKGVMELRCVIAVIRHGDRTPKQKMKMEVKHPMWFDLFKRMNGYDVGNVKLKKPKHLQEV